MLIAARFCMLYIRSCILFIHVVHFIVMIFKLVFEIGLQNMLCYF